MALASQPRAAKRMFKITAREIKVIWSKDPVTERTSYHQLALPLLGHRNSPRCVRYLSVSDFGHCGER